MWKHMQGKLAISLLVLVIPAHAQNQIAAKQPARVNSDTNASDAAHVPATTDPNYQIGVQDVLDISVWKEPDVSRMVPVRPDGKISLPLLNDIQAAGLTPAQLTQEITSGLTKYMTNPQVTVIVNQINSQRFYIVGSVSRAGAYLLLPGMTVLQALSNAGGFSEFANLKKIYVLRKENGKEEKLPFNYKDVSAGKHTEQNIVVQAGDTIFVP